MLSMAEANEQAIREGFSAAWPDGMRPTVRPTMPTKQPLASVKPVPQQASPRGQAAILSEKQKLALIKDTRNMIERHHKTMHDAFLAMDKDRNGRLDKDEVRRALLNWNMPLAPHEVDAIFATADVDNNGTIDWQEFAEAFREALQESPFRQGDVWKGG